MLSFHKGHAKLLCIIPILVYVLLCLSKHFNSFSEHKPGLPHIRSWTLCTICSHKTIMVAMSDLYPVPYQHPLSQYELKGGTHQYESYSSNVCKLRWMRLSVLLIWTANFDSVLSIGICWVTSSTLEPMEFKTLLTSANKGRKSRWGWAKSRWSSHPATWWSKHRVITHKTS